jgi:hypothetical protein
MKNLFLIVCLVVVAMTASAQRIDKSFVCATCAVTSDTVAAETVYYSYAVPVKTSDGILGFQFTKADLTDSCSVIKMQGSQFSTFTSVVDLTGTAALANTTTDGTTFLYVTDPVYLFYRLKVTAASGDAVKFTNVKLIYK